MEKQATESGLNEAYDIASKGHLGRFVQMLPCLTQRRCAFSGKRNPLKLPWLKPIFSLTSVHAGESAVSQVMKRGV